MMVVGHLQDINLGMAHNSVEENVLYLLYRKSQVESWLHQVGLGKKLVWKAISMKVWRVIARVDMDKWSELVYRKLTIVFILLECSASSSAGQ